MSSSDHEHNWKPKVGSRVKVQGLQGRADLNGRIGSVISPLDETTGRVGVQIFRVLGGKPEGVSIKPVNVVDYPPTFLDGFEVVDSGDSILGRISVAKQDYEVGEMVLVEPPTLVFDPQTGYQGMILAFTSSSKTIRENVLDMYCPSILPDDDEEEEGNSFDYMPSKAQQTKQRLDMLEQEYRRISHSDPTVKNLLPLDSAKKLLRIIDVNAHSFSLERTGALITTQSTRHKSYSALFAKGSKVEHSCNPNLSWAAEDGKLQYIATRPIKKGDRLSISYQPAFCEKPRRARQQFLRMNKDFTCGCHRCRGPDECHPYVISCPTCNNTATVAFSYGTDNEIRCIACQSTLPSASSDPQKKLEKVFEQQLDQIEYGLQSGSIVDEGPAAMSRMLKLQNNMAENLHPLHWLHPKGYRLVGSMAASFARFHMQRGRRAPPNAAATSFLFLSTSALLFQARWIKQVARIMVGNCALQDIATQKMRTPKMPKLPSAQGVQSLADELCEKEVVTYPIDMAHSIFHAGQDWLLCGEPSRVANLYKHFLPLFERWIRLSDENREKLLLLVESGGKENTFGNHLVF